MKLLRGGSFSPAVELQLTVAAGALAVCGVGMIISSLIGAAAGDPELVALLLPGVVGLVGGGIVVAALPKPGNRGGSIGRLELFTVLALPVALFDWLRRR